MIPMTRRRRQQNKERNFDVSRVRAPVGYNILLNAFSLKNAAFWHTTPLHYAPYLLATGVLYSQARLRTFRLPIASRRTAAKRDRKLHLDRYVHLSLTAKTPLLTDKLRRGYPHLLFEFDTAIASLPGAALCLYNAKSWRHREDFIPVTGEREKQDIFDAYAAGRYPSLELLIPDALPLHPHVRSIHFASEGEARFVRAFGSLNREIGWTERISPEHYSPLCVYDPAPLEQYLADCLEAGVVLPPPNLPFD